MSELPVAVDRVADVLASMRGTVAVVLGGSRAQGASAAQSDWDLGVYYRGDLDTTALGRLGKVHPPGSWGRVMNGGAWLDVDGLKVDVLLRDLDMVEHWSARAGEGEFEIDALLGYVAGVPTYSLAAERAVAVVLRGDARTEEAFPAKLAEAAPARWRFCADFSLAYARMHAVRGDRIATSAQAAKAIMEEAHARMCEARRWVLNEKRLVETAELTHLQEGFGAIPDDPHSLVFWAEQLRDALVGGRAAPSVLL